MVFESMISQNLVLHIKLSGSFPYCHVGDHIEDRGLTSHEKMIDNSANWNPWPPLMYFELAAKGLNVLPQLGTAFTCYQHEVWYQHLMTVRLPWLHLHTILLAEAWWELVGRHEFCEHKKLV